VDRAAVGTGTDGLGVTAAETGVTVPLTSRPTETTPYSTGRITGSSHRRATGGRRRIPRLAVPGNHIFHTMRIRSR
jgi:hypothetical protein